jgi:hypothetical protein
MPKGRRANAVVTLESIDWAEIDSGSRIQYQPWTDQESWGAKFQTIWITNTELKK